MSCTITFRSCVIKKGASVGGEIFTKDTFLKKGIIIDGEIFTKDSGVSESLVIGPDSNTRAEDGIVTMIKKNKVVRRRQEVVQDKQDLLSANANNDE